MEQSSPLQPRQLSSLGNAQKNENNEINHKKRQPTTPLTPSLIDRNVLKKKHNPLSNEIGGLIDKEGQDENYMFINKDQSPISKSQIPLLTTPNISKGIKMAVKDNKLKSRLQVLRNSELNNEVASDSEYSEISSISGDTPNYKVNNDLIYYKNGYYLKQDESLYELEKSAIINERELVRTNDLLDFMKLERKFEREEREEF
ncbi:hypothetical protein WICMUC_002199 [Wickerhamomyces mucosus]|uniref:Uncharacterized protein n=1 Tax=Wickerhamomyces mucosus TaxID=1378264 RepID=A0A9P8PQF4_9ASCO|nr:hypothetical protein WICMUC_002199 [Wickerhamomyces mucosus]